jgi:homopolymeric O-antigen transport system ATP-binding protein
MSSRPFAIHAEGLSKQYRLGLREPYKALRDVVADAFSAPYRRIRDMTAGMPRRAVSKIWVLEDVSFDVAQGEVVGIIGANGAGKSTLLKILSRITEPTRGEAVLRGRIGSLLEVGTGFHPELTGRENVFLNGAILGMRKNEIRARLDEIVEFSGLARFLDTPVKRYSSGMQVRLAFAVAAHLQPEILLVDEVLAVGDAEFQRKCLGKMQSVTQDEGRTILFVSHNIPAVRSLCPRSLLLEHGKLVYDGDTDGAFSRYLRTTGAGSAAFLVGDDLEKRKTTEKIYAAEPRFRCTSIALLDDGGRPRTDYRSDEAITVAIEYEVFHALPQLRLVVALGDEASSQVLRSENVDDPAATQDGSYGRDPGSYRASVTIPPAMFGNTTLNVSVMLLSDVAQTVTYEKAIEFTITFQGYNGNMLSRALIRPQLAWTDEPLTGSGLLAARLGAG